MEDKGNEIMKIKKILPPQLAAYSARAEKFGNYAIIRNCERG